MEMLLTKGMRGTRPDDLFFTKDPLQLPRITTFTQELRALLAPGSSFRVDFHKKLSMVLLDVPFGMDFLSGLEHDEKIPDADVLFYVRALS